MDFCQNVLIFVGQYSVSTGGWWWRLPSLSEQPSVLHTVTVILWSCSSTLSSPSYHQGQPGNITLQQKLLIGINACYHSAVNTHSVSQCIENDSSLLHFGCDGWRYVVSSCSASNHKPAEIEIWEKDILQELQEQEEQEQPMPAL